MPMSRRDLPTVLISNAVGTVLFASAWAMSTIVAARHAGLLGDTSRMDQYAKLRYEAGIGDFIAIAIGVWLVHATCMVLARIRWPLSDARVILLAEIIGGVTTWGLGRVLDAVDINGVGVFVAEICLITGFIVMLDSRVAHHHRA